LKKFFKDDKKHHLIYIYSHFRSENDSHIKILKTLEMISESLDASSNIDISYIDHDKNDIDGSYMD